MNRRVQHHHEFYIVNEKNERIATVDIYFKRGGLWLTNVWTHQDYRKQGLARQIVKTAIDMYSDKTIYLTVAPYWDIPMDEDNLINFYKSFGFLSTDVPDVMKRS